VIARQDENMGTIPFSASQASGSIICPNCGNLEFQIEFKYSKPYRRRCINCGAMFETLNSGAYRCEACEADHIKALARLGS